MNNTAVYLKHKRRNENRVVLICSLSLLTALAVGVVINSLFYPVAEDSQDFLAERWGSGLYALVVGALAAYLVNAALTVVGLRAVTAKRLSTRAIWALALFVPAGIAAVLYLGFVGFMLSGFFVHVLTGNYLMVYALGAITMIGLAVLTTNGVISRSVSTFVGCLVVAGLLGPIFWALPNDYVDTGASYNRKQVRSWTGPIMLVDGAAARRAGEQSLGIVHVEHPWHHDEDDYLGFTWGHSEADAPHARVSMYTTPLDEYCAEHYEWSMPCVPVGESRYGTVLQVTTDMVAIDVTGGHVEIEAPEMSVTEQLSLINSLEHVTPSTFIAATEGGRPILGSA